MINLWTYYTVCYDRGHTYDRDGRCLWCGHADPLGIAEESDDEPGEDPAPEREVDHG